MSDNPFSDIQFALRKNVSNLASGMRQNTVRAKQDLQMSIRPVRQRHWGEYFGNGRAFPTAPIMFANTFVEEPSFTYGVVVREGISNLYAGTATAFVLRWVTSSDGNLYRGAQMCYYVDVRDIQNNPVNQAVKLSFSLVFEGNAIPIPVASSG